MIDAQKIALVLVLAAAAYLAALAALRLTMAEDDETKEERSTLPRSKTTVAKESAQKENGFALPAAEYPKEESKTTTGTGATIEAANPVLPRSPDTEPLPEVETQVEIPAGETPAGVALDGEIAPEKCWDSSGLEQRADNCDALKSLETRLLERLYIMDQCRMQAAGENAVGGLDLGMEVDFAKPGLSFWGKPSSKLTRAVETAACIKDRFKNLRFPRENPRFVRYQYSLTIRFFDERLEREPSQIEASQVIVPDTAKGSYVSVVRDRVRVRKKPVDGEILCKISSGSRALLFDRQGEWCFIRTARGTAGWMVCWALGLSDAGPNAP
jgi:hypothetical protein